MAAAAMAASSVAAAAATSSSRCGSTELAPAASTSGRFSATTGLAPMPDARLRFTSRRPAQLLSTARPPLHGHGQQLPTGAAQCQHGSPSAPAPGASSPSKPKPTTTHHWQTLETAYRSPSPSSTTDTSKGWHTPTGTHQRADTTLRLLAAACLDRAEMHAALAIQRDNWNALFNVSLTLATLSAALAAALAASLPSHATPLWTAAGALDVAAAGTMAVLFPVQPSQLAEEQRAAARLFRALAAEFQGVLQTSPALREHAGVYLPRADQRVLALDAAFPMPLLPMVLEKFPAVVRPSVLAPPVDRARPVVEVGEGVVNGWTAEVAADLARVAERVRAADGDVAEYLGFMRKYLRINQAAATLGPVAAAVAAMACVVGAVGGEGVEQQVAAGAVAAGCGVAAWAGHAVSSCFQLGMVFEMYRNCAGYYAELEGEIERVLRVPVELREDGGLVHRRVAAKLGRPDRVPLLAPGERLAGKLF